MLESRDLERVKETIEELKSFIDTANPLAIRIGKKAYSRVQDIRLEQNQSGKREVFVTYGKQCDQLSIGFGSMILTNGKIKGVAKQFPSSTVTISPVRRATMRKTPESINQKKNTLGLQSKKRYWVPVKTQEGVRYAKLTGTSVAVLKTLQGQKEKGFLSAKDLAQSCEAQLKKDGVSGRVNSLDSNLKKSIKIQCFGSKKEKGLYWGKRRHVLQGQLRSDLRGYRRGNLVEIKKKPRRAFVI